MYAFIINECHIYVFHSIVFFSEMSASSSASPKPEDCSICLDVKKEKAFTDSCFHSFCFKCLVEWSAVKSVCPLCKQPFSTIIHNVKAHDDYEQFYVENRQRNVTSGSGERPIFRYRTTLDRVRSHLQGSYNVRRLSASSRHSVRPITAIGTRKEIYRTNKWVKPSADGRYSRVTSPEFYKSSPACIHRLVPWVSRELRAVMAGITNSDRQFVLEVIIGLLTKVEIKSARFRDHLQPFLGNKTMHFIHEFYHFSSSPHSMLTYDRHAVYDNHEHENTLGNRSPSRRVDSDEEDVIILPSPKHQTIIIDDEDDDVIIEHDNQTPGHSSWETPYLGHRTVEAPIIVDDDDEAATACTSRSLDCHFKSTSRWDNPVKKSKVSLKSSDHDLDSLPKSSIDSSSPSSSNSVKESPKSSESIKSKKSDPQSSSASSSKSKHKKHKKHKHKKHHSSSKRHKHQSSENSSKSKKHRKNSDESPEKLKDYSSADEKPSTSQGDIQCDIDSVFSDINKIIQSGSSTKNSSDRSLSSKKQSEEDSVILCNRDEKHSSTQELENSLRAKLEHKVKRKS